MVQNKRKRRGNILPYKSQEECASEFLSNLPEDREGEAVMAQGFKYTPAEPLPPDMEFEDDEEDAYDADEALVQEMQQYEEQEGNGDVEMGEDDEKHPAGTKKVWNPRGGQLGEDEVLDHDPRAYKVYHKMAVEWPSLSFDVYRDGLGDFRSKKYPMTATIIAGSCAPVALKNKLSVYKVTQVRKTKYDIPVDSDEEDSNDEESSDEDICADEMEMFDRFPDPVVEERSIKHEGGINRVRIVPQAPHVAATWGENGKVSVWDLKPLIDSICPDQIVPSSNRPHIPAPENAKPMFVFKGHGTEGFAMDWSPVFGGRLVTGDSNRHIYLWEPNQGSGSWSVDKVPYHGHTSSVEDLQWSPTQQEVFASCSSDRSIRIWDCRNRKQDILRVENAHESDVNVISWNRSASAAHLLVSGSDDGSFKVWDLRAFKSSQPAGHFKWHTSPITSVEWHPTQESVIAVASEDDSISVWDLGLEADAEALQEAAKQFDEENLKEIPPQLSFVHRGMNQVKELHFHPQIPSLIFCTTEDGFDLFKPDNL